MTDERFNEILTEEFKKIVPLVREGVYTGEDVDMYITFVYYVRGTMFANDAPTAKLWSVTATLWVRKGIPAYKLREQLKSAITALGGTYPTVETATDDGWQQYVYEFECAGGVPEV